MSKSAEPASLVRSARERARDDITAAITACARAQLALVGPTNLSVRAIARELGMASSAVYRYFPSRDDLLNALLLDAYAELAEVLTDAVRLPPSRGVVARWLAAARAVRGWAVDEPHHYALVYGTPVPGYAAPAATIAPAEAMAGVWLGLVADGYRRGEIHEGPTVSVTAELRSELHRIGALIDTPLPLSVIQRALGAWTQLFGHLSFELFGQFNQVIDQRDAFFDAQMRLAATSILGHSDPTAAG